MTRIRVMFASVLVLFATALFAQTPTPTPPPAQTAAGAVLEKFKDPATAKQLSDALAILQDVANQPASDKDHKTVGDALNKGFDMAKDTVVYLAAKIEQVAPQLWRVLVVQQYVKGTIGLINPIGFLLLVVVYRRLLLKWWKPMPGDDDAKTPAFDGVNSDEIPIPTHKGVRNFFAIVVPLVAIIPGGIWLYTSLTAAVGYFVNPNYYALHDIIALLRNPGAF